MFRLLSLWLSPLQITTTTETPGSDAQYTHRAAEPVSSGRKLYIPSPYNWIALPHGSPTSRTAQYEQQLRGWFYRVRSPWPDLRDHLALRSAQASDALRVSGFGVGAARFRLYAALCTGRSVSHAEEVSGVLHSTLGAIDTDASRTINGVRLHAAKEQRIESRTQVRIDGTVTESHILEPSDSRVLYDGVLVLTRLLRQAQQRCCLPLLQRHVGTYCVPPQRVAFDGGCVTSESAGCQGAGRGARSVPVFPKKYGLKTTDMTPRPGSTANSSASARVLKRVFLSRALLRSGPLLLARLGARAARKVSHLPVRN